MRIPKGISPKDRIEWFISIMQVIMVANPEHERQIRRKMRKTIEVLRRQAGIKNPGLNP